MYFRQPEYYNSFKCVGGSCNYTCCCGWEIIWTQEEIDKVVNAPNCSDKLKQFMNNFKVANTDDSKFTIKLTENKRCPFLTEDNLCGVQKELGEEYLSSTCKVYPRIYRLSYNHNTGKEDFLYRAGRLSCPEIAKRVITDKNAMKLVNIKNKKVQTLSSIFIDEDYEQYPEHMYRTDIFEFFYNLISDKRYSVETAVINGAIAAQILTEIIAEKNYAFIPQALKELHDGFIKGGMFNDIEKMKSDYIMKFGFLMKIINIVEPSGVTNMLRTQDGKLDLTLYKNGEANLNVIFNNEDYWLRNIALNLLFELKIPFYSPDYTLFESYRLFVAAFACYRLNAVATISRGETTIGVEMIGGMAVKYNSLEGIWGFASTMSRRMCQNIDVANSINDVLKAAKFNSPASLAVLIK